MAYSNEVIDHYENPRNVGSLDKKDENVGTGLVGAPACGDVMRLQIRVSDEGVIETLLRSSMAVNLVAARFAELRALLAEQLRLLQEI